MLCLLIFIKGDNIIDINNNNNDSIKDAVATHVFDLMLDTCGEGHFGQSFADAAGREKEIKYLENFSGVKAVKLVHEAYGYVCTVQGTDAQITNMLVEAYAEDAVELIEFIAPITSLTQL